jgi:CheY-like chemotaxis protein
MPRILVVDDDLAVQAVVRLVLTHAGHEVIVADNGRKAIAEVAPGAVDAVICDIFMPGMDGLETLRAFRQRDPKVPFIVMSGFMFHDSLAPVPDFLGMAAKLGAAYSLRKPFRAADLLKAVDHSLAKAAPNFAAAG